MRSNANVSPLTTMTIQWHTPSPLRPSPTSPHGLPRAWMGQDASRPTPRNTDLTNKEHLPMRQRLIISRNGKRSFDPSQQALESALADPHSLIWLDIEGDPT